MICTDCASRIPREMRGLKDRCLYVLDRLMLSFPHGDAWIKGSTTSDIDRAAQSHPTGTHGEYST